MERREESLLFFLLFIHFPCLWSTGPCENGAKGEQNKEKERQTERESVRENDLVTEKSFSFPINKETNKYSSLKRETAIGCCERIFFIYGYKKSNMVIWKQIFE